MVDADDRNLQIIESELNFLRRHIQNILTEDFDGIHEADLAICSALRSLEGYRLSRQLIREELPACVRLTTQSKKGLPEVQLR